MAAYTTPDLNDYLPGEPLTSAKALLMVENPIAIAEGDPSAPKISPNAQGVASFAGQGNSSVVLSDFSSYRGVEIAVSTWHNLGVSGAVFISLSADGSSYGASTTIATSNSNNVGEGKMILDLTTGSFVTMRWSGPAAPTAAAGTVAVPGTPISHIRISGSPQMEIGVIAKATGGDYP